MPKEYASFGRQEKVLILKLKRLIHLFRIYFFFMMGIAIISGLLAYVLSIRSIPLYASTITVLMGQPLDSTKEPSSETLLFNERLSKTYIQLLTTKPLLEKVVDNLQLHTDATTLANESEVIAIANTQLLQLTVKSTDAQEAASIANEIIRVFNMQQADQQRQQLEQDIEKIRAEINRIQKEMALSNNDQQKQNINSIEGNYDQYMTTYKTLSERLAQLQESKLLSTEILQVIDPAIPSSKPVRPQVLIVTLLGTVFGGFLGVSIIILLGYINNTIYSQEDVEQLNIATLVAPIPNLRSTSLHMPSVNIAPHSRIADAFRALWIEIEMVRSKPIESLLITSIKSRQGASVCVINLAVLLARMGKRVVVVDANLRYPSLHLLAYKDNNAGLTTALQDDSCSIDELLVPIFDSNLKLMFSGPIISTSSDLLDSRRFKDILTQLQERADIVLFDAPPINDTIDAIKISHFCDTTLLVIQSGKTSVGDLQKIKKYFSKHKSDTLGFVLIDESTVFSDIYYIFRSIANKLVAISLHKYYKVRDNKNIQSVKDNNTHHNSMMSRENNTTNGYQKSTISSTKSIPGQPLKSTNHTQRQAGSLSKKRTFHRH